MTLFPRLTREMFRTRAVSGAVGAFAASLLALGAAVVSYVRIADVAPAAGAAGLPDAALRFATPAPAADLDAAIRRDLFADDRHPPAKRYRLPGETDAPAPQISVRPVVLGTAIAEGGASFAMCQLADGSIVKAWVGTKVGDYTVVAIARTRVTFRAGDGEQFTLDASNPAP